MRILIQRVSRAQVAVAGQICGAIGVGVVALVGIHRDDGPKQVAYCADKCAGLRIFPDEAGRMNLDVGQAGGGVLAVSQFTLYGDCRRGRRPGFDAAAAAQVARPLYEAFVLALEQRGLSVAKGIFGADMAVELCNWGPVTLMVESS